MEIHSRCIRVSDRLSRRPRFGCHDRIRAGARGIRSVSGLQYGSMANASLGIGASLDGSVPFPADNA